MKLVFPALEARFKSRSDLVSLARKLVMGYEGQKVTGPLPYVDVTCLDDLPYDSFGADFETYQLKFTIHTDRSQPGKANDIKEIMVDVFDDANLVSQTFSTVNCTRVGSSGPVLNDKVYDVELDYLLTIQRKAMKPAVRRM